ncbi:MAG: hypothetical protein ABIJ40_17080 [Bacteroidota bacterium]
MKNRANHHLYIFMIIFFICGMLNAQVLSKKIVISDIKKLKDAINTAAFGDTVEVVNGKYDAGTSLTITNSEQKEIPLLLKHRQPVEWNLPAAHISIFDNALILFW